MLPCPNAESGLFATMTYVLGALELYEQGTFGGLTVNFYKAGLYYDPAVGNNWWNYYFEPIFLPPKPNQEPRKMTLQEINLACRAGLALSRERRHQLIDKHVKLQPHIQKKVERFVQDYFQGRRIVGVHFRGTDKKKEVPRISYDAVAAAIDARDLSEAYLFVATDEAAFLEYMNGRYPGRVIAAPATRSTDGRPLHFDAPDKYRIGEEAVIDCLLLSRCDFLVRTLSDLSKYSTYFNLNLPSIIVQ